MNLLICGDLHISEKRPENRIDDYFFTQSNKIRWILEFAKTNNATILLPGDMFDNYKQSNFILEYYITLFKMMKVPIYTIWGQHDQKYHSTDLQDTPLAVLAAAKALAIADYGNAYYLKECSVYGSSFGEDIPKIKKDSFVDFNILLTHRMIIHSDKIWNAQEEFDYAENLLRKHDFDLIVSGDNHHFFIAKQKDKLLVNCGSLMRATTAQLDHIPKVVLFDTVTRKYKEYEIPIKLISEVFNLEKITIKKEKEEKFEAFINGLNESKGMDLSFQDNLDNYLKENEIDNDVVMILKEAMHNENG